MKRIILFLLLPVCTLLHAQEKYSEYIEKANGLSAYEAIYLLRTYQQAHPENAAVYYELGNRCYELLPTRNALYHYTELHALLYDTRLFYGNCLHFAADQKLPGWQYPLVANGQKRIEYEQLALFIQPRLEEVQRLETACEAIHGAFYQMVERYNRCQALFTAFLTRYTREKTAHLQLHPEERVLLNQLRLCADSLEQDIKAYQKALTLQPVEGYEPVFHKEPIQLYRLDGLTQTNFLQNDVALWDYSAWVQGFLEEQKEVYERLYTDLQEEHERLSWQLRRYCTGGRINGEIDATLIPRCKRLELTIPRVNTVSAMQQAVQCGAAEQQIETAGQSKTLRELAVLAQMAQTPLAVTVPADEEWKSVIDSAQRLIEAHLIQRATPLATLAQPTYTHPVSGDVRQYTPEAGETVYALMPDDDKFRCVVSNDQGETLVLQLGFALSRQRTLLRVPNETPLVLLKLPVGQWALITNKHVHFLP